MTALANLSECLERLLFIATQTLVGLERPRCTSVLDVDTLHKVVTCRDTATCGESLRGPNLLDTVLLVVESDCIGQGRCQAEEERSERFKGVHGGFKNLRLWACQSV